MLPVMATSGFPIDQLDEALAKGPQLKTSERLAMAEDIRAVRANLKAKADPWAWWLSPMCRNWPSDPALN